MGQIQKVQYKNNLLDSGSFSQHETPPSGFRHHLIHSIKELLTTCFLLPPRVFDISESLLLHSS